MTALTVVGGFIASVTGLLMFVVKRRDEKKDTIPRAQAEIAMTVENVGVLRSINDGVVAELRRSEEARAEELRRVEEAHRLELRRVEEARERDFAELRAIRDDLAQSREVQRNHERQIADLQEGFARMKGLFGKATQFIEDLLRHMIKQGMYDGMPALPAQLHAFIDPELHQYPPRRTSGDEFGP